MGNLFDEGFCTTEHDRDIIDFIEKNFMVSSGDWDFPSKYIVYGTGCDYFWASDNGYYEKCRPKLTKQQFKVKIGMIDKEAKKGEMVSYKLIDEEGFLKASAANSSILEEMGSDIFTGKHFSPNCLVDTDGNVIIGYDEFRFFEKVDNDTQAELITEPVAQPDNELGMLRYQSLIDDCKELSINLVVTDEGLHILDCLNSVEYKIEVPDDYQKIVDALRLLQNKEMD